MGFDSEGNLYVTTGDTNSSQGSNGYSGNNPTAKCPTGPNDEPSSDHCGTAGYSYQDARRTAGNTNDYNGKMLRFRPDPDSAGRQHAAPGAGSTYTLPDGRVAERAEPVRRHGARGERRDVRPSPRSTPWACATRRACTSIRRRTSRTPRGSAPTPGARARPRARRRTRTRPRSRTPATTAGPTAWATARPTATALADGSLRTTNAPGYVSGGPASGGTDGWYDCNNIHNDSPNNTGLVELPHETGTGMDAGKQRHVNLWYSRGNPNNANGCPDFPRPRGEDAAPDYGATPTQLCPYLRQRGHDGHGRPGLPVRRRRGGRLAPLAGVLGRPLVPAQQRRRERQARAALRPGDGRRRRPAGLRRLVPRRPELGRRLHGLEVRRGRRALRPGLRRASSARARTPASGASTTRAAPNTPGANPSAFPRGGNRVAFSSAGSGGIAYSWDFGDGSADSTEADPTHQYATPGTKTVTLTVTYERRRRDRRHEGDRGRGHRGRRRGRPDDHGDDEPGEPERHQAGDRDAVGDRRRRPRRDPDGVPRQRRRLDGVHRPVPALRAGGVHGRVPLDRPGEQRRGRQAAHVHDLRARRTARRTSTTSSTATTLDPRWERLNPDDTALSVGDGFLDLEIREGDVFGDQATAKNILLQEAPDGPFMVTTRLDVRDLGEEGQQAGLVLWSEEDPNTFAKIVFINKGDVPAVRVRRHAQRPGGHPRRAELPDDAARGVRPGARRRRGLLHRRGVGRRRELAADLRADREPRRPRGPQDRPEGLGRRRRGVQGPVPVLPRGLLGPHRAGELRLGEPGAGRRQARVVLRAADGHARGDATAAATWARSRYRIDDGAVQTYDDAVPGHRRRRPRRSGTGRRTTPPSPTSSRPTCSACGSTGRRPRRASTSPGPRVPNGPVDVTLDPQDGAGSGAVLTQYRVDGGPWKAYAAEDEQIFDGSPGSLAQWTHDGDGGFELLGDDSGGIGPTPSGGLGMLWYPVKAVRRLPAQARVPRGPRGRRVLQRRRVRPLPGSAARRSPSGRSAAGRATPPNAPEWVAIQCGHEIQLYDGQTGEERKTGSIYTFDNNDIDGDRTRVAVRRVERLRDRGRRPDLPRLPQRRADQGVRELAGQGVGPRAAIRRPASASSRRASSACRTTAAPTGWTTATSASRTSRRTRRVPTRPARSRVEGAGPHTVEVRSVDAAGNVEAKKALDFEIGEVAPPVHGRAGPDRCRR